MFTHPNTKSDFGKSCRSGLNHCITVILPVKQATEEDNRSDAVGGLMVVCLSLAIIFLMRFMLEN